MVKVKNDRFNTLFLDKILKTTNTLVFVVISSGRFYSLPYGVLDICLPKSATFKVVFLTNEEILGFQDDTLVT